MKNLYSKNEFLNLKFNDVDIINEGFFGNLFGKLWASIKSIKGGKELQQIYNKYVDIINKELEKAKLSIRLNKEGEQVKQGEQAKPAGEQQPKPAGGQQQNNSLNFNYFDKLYEADQPNTNTDQQQNTDQKPEEKQKVPFDKSEHQKLLKILNLQKAQAKKEMDKVLTNLGGGEKNPKLSLMINTFMYKFDLALIDAEFEKSGDKTLEVQKKKLETNITANMKNIQKGSEIVVGNKKFKLNTPYQYNAGGKIKTIVVTGKSDDNDATKVKGKFLSAEKEYGGQQIEQPFRINYIKTDFGIGKEKPAKDTEYMYFSKKQNKVIPVKVITEPNKNGSVQIQGKDISGAVWVNSGALIPIKKKEEGEKPGDVPAPAQVDQQTPVQNK